MMNRRHRALVVLLVIVALQIVAAFCLVFLDRIPTASQLALVVGLDLLALATIVGVTSSNRESVS